MMHLTMESVFLANQKAPVLASMYTEWPVSLAEEVFDFSRCLQPEEADHFKAVLKGRAIAHYQWAEKRKIASQTVSHALCRKPVSKRVLGMMRRFIKANPLPNFPSITRLPNRTKEFECVKQAGRSVDDICHYRNIAFDDFFAVLEGRRSNPKIAKVINEAILEAKRKLKRRAISESVRKAKREGRLAPSHNNVGGSNSFPGLA